MVYVEASISPLALLGLAVLGLVVILLALRVLGLWLQRKGRAMEEGPRPAPPDERPRDPFGSE